MFTLAQDACVLVRLSVLNKSAHNIIPKMRPAVLQVFIFLSVLRYLSAHIKAKCGSADSYRGSSRISQLCRLFYTVAMPQKDGLSCCLSEARKQSTYRFRCCFYPFLRRSPHRSCLSYHNKLQHLRY